MNKGGMRMPLIQTGGNYFLTECLMHTRDAELEHEEDITSEKEP